MSKHTPGPWSYIGNGDVVAKSNKYCGGEKDIASVFLTVNDEDEANARLIAAAPDLLEALKACADWLDWLVTPHDDPKGAHAAHIKQARAAIAKATGATNV